MNAFAPALAIADSILYEGYILYPYRASALKNRVRWQFGVIAPSSYAKNGTGEPIEQQTEVLLECNADTTIDVLVRFLQIVERRVETWNGSTFEMTDSLRIGNETHVTFDEGVEREVQLACAGALGTRAMAPIAFAFDKATELLHDEGGELRGRVVRDRCVVVGEVTVECLEVPDFPAVRKIRVRIENYSEPIAGTRSAPPRTSFVSTHALLRTSGGYFLSTFDPPKEIAGKIGLDNRNTWPVLVADASLVLSSPIILYDFPLVAPQSEADTYDGLEIDELMMLSVRSLSDAEREEAKATDARARGVIERAERFGAEELDALHGALDVPSIDCVFVDGVKIAKGSLVRLHPKRRADAWDIFLDGKLATVQAIHQDVENLSYVAVTVDEDPASDLHEWYGRSFFFYPDEVRPAFETERVL